MTAHRRARAGHGRDVFMLAAFTAALVITIASLLLWGNPGPPRTAAAPVVHTTATVTATVTARPGPRALAYGTKPLAALEPGDRVLYSVPPAKRRVCRWQAWGGVLDDSLIRCGTDPQMWVKTGYLTPMEPR